MQTVSPKAYVTEVVEPDALCLLESKVVDLDEVNYLAKLMDSEDETEKNTLFAVTACEGYDTPKELINLHFNLGCYTLVQPTDDAEAVGRRYMYSMKPCMTMKEAANTDFEKIGKNLLVLKKGIQTDYGTVFRNEEVEGQEIYDGQVFPCYHYTGEELLCIEAEYKDKKEYLYLPEEPMSITKALHRLGAEKPEDCTYQVEDFNVDSKEWRERFERMVQNENIFDVNAVAEKLNNAETENYLEQNDIKQVYLIPPVSSTQKEAQNEFRQKHVVAYCRVSTKQEEQLNSYETQRAAYIDMINKNPDWTLVKIFADKGITGTSVKRRDGFNKMIRLCKQGKVKSIMSKTIIPPS